MKYTALRLKANGRTYHPALWFPLLSGRETMRMIAVISNSH